MITTGPVLASTTSGLDMRFRRLVLLATLGCSPLSARSAQRADPVTLPFTISADGLLLVASTLGDSISARVILDTGAGLDILAPSLIRRVRGTPNGTFTGIRMTGDRVTVPLFNVPAVSFGPLVRRDVVVGAWDVLDSLHVDGILSLLGLRTEPLTIDFANQQVIFETPQSLAGRQERGASVPLVLDDLRGKSLDVFAEFLLGPTTGECELDTGSQGTTLSTRYLAPLAIDTTAHTVDRRTRRTITGAAERRYVATVPQLALAKAPNVVTVSPRVTFSDIIYDCVVGTSFWAGRTITIDILHRRLIVDVSGGRS